MIVINNVKYYTEEEGFEKIAGGTRCPMCKARETEVFNSRYSERWHTTWRRRKCKSCNHVWGTIEIINPEYNKEIAEREELSKQFRERMIEENRIRTKAKYDRRKANGECVRCGMLLPDDHKGCECDSCKAIGKARRMKKAIQNVKGYGNYGNKR